MKYNLLINKRTNVLSSNIKANKAIIKEINDSNPIPTKKEIRKSKKGQIPNHGKLPVTRKIIIPQKKPIMTILIKTLKYVWEK
jgi:hypothetical protein